ncbi:MAG: 16S rRNA (guanine(966)-N(2))-methyltransferase RsmD [Lachnospiraceae bacterium]|nr:16S rRNA (guanine(966)-N(2))-methyltransferase RsmD [Lachnospiraceae bacterium]
MRVIAGTARSIPLKAPAGMDTRPTADKIKETLFNILQFEVQGAVFADLFAGSGAIGIEALSRGADRALFIDSAKPAVDVIRDNVRKCHFEDRAEIIRADAMSAAAYVSRALKAAEPGTPLIVFMDPPYDKGLEFPVLASLSAAGILNEDSLVIVEESLRCDMSPAEELGFTVCREKLYKNQKHVFMHWEPVGAAPRSR